MPRHLQKIALRVLYGVLFALQGCGMMFPPVAHAQFTYTSPQTIEQQNAGPGANPSNPSIICTSALVSTVTVPNNGQSVHTVAFNVVSGGAVNVFMTGSPGGAAGEINIISQTVSGTMGVASAFGYYHTVIINIACPTGNATVNLSYSGTSVAPGILTGQSDLSNYDYILASGAPAGTTKTFTLQPPPYGSTGGTLYFIFSGAGPSGSTLAITAGGSGSGPLGTFTCNLVTTTLLIQTCPVPPTTASSVNVVYTNGAVSSNFYTLEYVFTKPGTALPSAGVPLHVASASATVVKPGPGTLTKIVVNTPSVGTITLFDLASSACTGTPSTNVKAVLTVTATGPVGTVSYDALFANGICVLASSASIDFTAVSQ